MTPQDLRDAGAAAPDSDAQYWSCEWIEGGLAFNRRSLHSCLIVHHHRGYPHLVDYKGGPIPVEALLEARERIRRANKSGAIHEACEGCPHLVKSEWKPKQYAFDILGIAQFSHCNIACDYCFLQTQERSSFADGFRPYQLFDELERLYEDGHLAPDAIIDWGGGEPTVYREFDRITDTTLRRGAFHYLHSNGVRFPAFLDGHPNADNLHIICSVDAGRPETYVKIKARDYLEDVWASLRRYKEAGCRVTVKYIVKEENAGPEDTVSFLERATTLAPNSLIIDKDFNQPDSSPRVIAGLARLIVGARAADLHVTYGFTGENFAKEAGTEVSLARALREL